VESEEEHKENTEEGEMEPCRTGHTEGRRCKRDVTTNEVNDRRSEYQNNDQKEKIGPDEGEEGKSKDIKTEVTAKERVSLPEGDTVTEEEVGLPPFRSIKTENKAQEETDPLDKAFDLHRLDRLAEDLGEFSEDKRDTLRSKTVGRTKIEIEDPRSQKTDKTPKQEPRRQDRRKNRAKTDFTKPEIVGIQTNSRAAEREEHKTGGDQQEPGKSSGRHRVPLSKVVESL
jgi:hypothetical protein